ncbi:MYB-like protein [Purpureocillium lavendulum]|uniref:MYB-like protein n=1 Tax=Purpureocillium lavendulum TaxID=1247861 RepID=A0AB34FF97_9HYPO|nr:MYB-like protein [Purpureocillium lavendulum]
MPKHNRSASGQASHYAQMASGLPSPLYAQQRIAVPASYYTIPGAPTSSMSQQLASQQQSQAQTSYDAAAAAAAAAAVSSSSYAASTDPSSSSATAGTTTTTLTAIPPGHHRPSSGAWSPADDNQLVAARMQGLNWGQIKDAYFQSKTANACRKRHERLMERKGADDWDGRKLQRLAKEYMGMRREIWSGLAARTGEKWNVVEQKCMSNGLKNLQSAARAASRRDRLETSGGAHSVTGYDDDSGISGIGLTPVDELDAPYGSPDATASSSASSYGGGSDNNGGGLTPSHYLHAHHQQQQQQQHHQNQQHHHHHQSQSQHHQHRHAQHAHQQYQQHLQPHLASYATVSTYGPPSVSYSHGYSSSVSSTASRTRYGTSEGSSPYMDAERLTGLGDMGIGAVMNRSGGRG